MKNTIKNTLRSITAVKVISALSIVLSLVLLTTAATSDLLPPKYLFSLLFILAIFDALSILAFYIPKSKKRMRMTALIIGVVTSIIYSVGIFSITTSIGLINKVTGDSSIVKKDVPQSTPFNLYISGIDTSGDINTVSRSDVNIVATVNPQTKHILLTTIPRDSYVKIAGGGNNQYDKLTHAGNYGVIASMQTVAQLLNTNIDTYTRINFTSFMKMVDEIDGIDVINPIEFKTDSGQLFKQGTLHLNGKDALTFSRERHNLAGGDNDRGLNQERVITAIFQKITSPSVLRNYGGILGVLGDSIQTNISQKSLTGLINQQLNGGESWKIDTTPITGKGQTGGLTSYAMPNSQLYMFVLNDQSVLQAQTRIHDVQNTSIK